MLIRRRDAPVVLPSATHLASLHDSLATLCRIVSPMCHPSGTKESPWGRPQTFPRCPAYMLANVLRALALLHHVFLTDLKNTHQHGRRMPFERSVPPYNSEPHFRAYETPIEVARSQTTLCYPWKSLCVPKTRIQSTSPPTTPAAGHSRRRPPPPLTTPTAGYQPPRSPTARPPLQWPAPVTEAVQPPLDDRPP